MSVSSSDTTLIQAARDGNRAAFGALYDGYRSMIHGILLAHVPPSDAEDLVQTVFLHALQQLPGLREPGAFGGWLVKIARHVATDFHRTRRNVVEIDEQRDSGKGWAASASTEAAAALAAIRRLPEAYRETLLLRLVEGMTGPEIAARTGLTPDSVRVNLSRGMKLLRAELGGVAAHGR